MRNALADGGLAMQWNGGDSETEYKLLMRTFVSVFPYTTLWGDGSLMLGSMKPFTLSQSAYEARRVTVRAVSVGPGDAEAHLHRGAEEIRAFVGDGPVLTDDKPVIEYFLSLPKNDAPGGYTGRRARFEAILPAVSAAVFYYWPIAWPIDLLAWSICRYARRGSRAREGSRHARCVGARVDAVALQS